MPTPAEQAQSRKIFKVADQLKDKSAAGRRRLAEVLLSEAAKTLNTPIDHFVLLSGAVQSGEEAGSLKLSFDGIDALAKSCVIHSLSAKADAATKVWSSVTPATATVGNVQNALDLIDGLVTDDDFSTAAKVEAALKKGLGSIRDAELKAATANNLRDFEAARSEREKLRASFEVLKKSSTDPAANTAVGSFWCFTVGRWERGLPFLARGNDSTIKNLAVKESLHATDVEDVADVANGWWELATTMSDSRKTLVQVTQPTCIARSLTSCLVCRG